MKDILAPGDIVGEGCSLQGEPIRLISISPQLKLVNDRDNGEPAQECEVVRRLDPGSGAMVYLVKEVLSRSTPSEDGHTSTIGVMEYNGDVSRCSETVYGREYAIECLPKTNFDEEALAARLTKVAIHQSLHSHPKIVTLHRTLETSSFLLLLLEHVPGKDLFYFVEQVHDHYETDTLKPVSVSRTPPTSSLLSNLHPSQLLSQARLRLIASMFAQMCDAVAACHAQQVFHRDVKPENFIVTKGWTALPDGRQKREIVVKLTNFSLSTTDVESSDKDYGSVPYMSYECRNKVTPTYCSRAADVWSLGVVLINMLYHFNPWTDASHGACALFDLFHRDPVNFFMSTFIGMTRPVADFLANRVFCILDDPGDGSPRVTAEEFGIWVKKLPILLGGCHDLHQTQPSGSADRLTSLSNTPFRSPSVNAKSPRTSASTTRLPFHGPSPGLARENIETCELFTAYNRVLEDQSQKSEEAEEIRSKEVRASNEMCTSPMNSVIECKKRRIQRGEETFDADSTSTTTDKSLASLATTSQNLAREIGMLSQAISLNSVSFEELLKCMLVLARRRIVLSVPAPGKNPPSSSVPSPGSGFPHPRPMPTTKSNVASLIMGLDDPIRSSTAGSTSGAENNLSTWTRGHEWRGSTTLFGPANESAGYETPSTSNFWNLGEKRSARAVSPHSTRSASSTTSGSDSRSCYYSCISTTNTPVSSAPWDVGSEGTRSPAPSPILVIQYHQRMSMLPYDRVSSLQTWKVKEPKLDIISEWAKNHGIPLASNNIPRDTTTNAVNLMGGENEEGGVGVDLVRRDQLNALNEVLSALRRP